MVNRRMLMTLRRRLPTLCMIGGAISGLAALYFTGKATVKAVRKYDELKENGIEITPQVIVKQFVPYYIPAIGFAVTSLACNITCNTVHAKRNRMLSLAATNAAETLKDFRAKTKEVIGEDKVKEIETEQAKDVVTLKSEGSYDSPIKVYDLHTGVKILTSYKKLHEAETEVNARLSDSGWTKGTVDLRTFYRYLGINEKDLEGLIYGTKLWDRSYMYEMFECNWVRFEHEEVFDRDGTLMVMLTYGPEPVYEHIIEESFSVC